MLNAFRGIHTHHVSSVDKATGLSRPGELPRIHRPGHIRERISRGGYSFGHDPQLKNMPQKSSFGKRVCENVHPKT